MPDAKLQVAEQIRRGERCDLPFLHHIVPELLPRDVLANCVTAPFPPVEIAPRHNGLRSCPSRSLFVTSDNSRDEPFASLSSLFASDEVVASLRDISSANLKNAQLRIALYSDRQGFWLKPHTDISEKLLTVIVYLSQAVQDEMLGTDLYDSKLTRVATTVAVSNSALVFRPGANTFHGFEPRIITGERRTLVINYVDDTWKDRSKLSGIVA